MAKRGPKPKPTTLKIVTGNPGKRKMPEAGSEPDPQGPVVMPPELKENERAVKLWEGYAPELIRIRVLKSTDAHMFGMWCLLTAEYYESPRHFTAAKITEVRALGSSFGMDPSTRTRFAQIGDKPAPHADPAEKYFKKSSG